MVPRSPRRGSPNCARSASGNRLARSSRGASDPAHPGTVPTEVVTGLDVTQRNVVAALAGDGRLLVIEGAAGAGKTTTLAAARTVIEDVGQRLIVVTPTKKAAQVAAKQLGTAAF